MSEQGLPRVLRPARRAALGALDRAFELARTQPAAELAKAWAPGMAIAWLMLALYYTERVEGVRSLRPVFALGLVLAWCARACVLGRWAGRRAAAELALHGVAHEHGSTSSLARASLWVGFELWLWLWLLVLALHLDPWFVPVILPLLALRSAAAPSWLAVADAPGPTSGFQALKTAVVHCEGQRGQAIVAELLLLVGGLGLCFNLGAVAAALIALGQSVFGLDLAFVGAFLSPRNHFSLLAVAALSFAALEPLRAALSAVLYVDAELARGGVAVRALVTRAIASSVTRGRVNPLLVALLLGLLAGEAQAQEEEEPCDAPCQRAREHDHGVSGQVDAILGEPEFAEFPDDAWSVDELGQSAVESWFERLMRWLMENDKKDDSERPASQRPLNLPGPRFFFSVAAVLAALGLIRLLAARGTRAARPRSLEPALAEDPLTRAPEAHLEDAVALASHDLRRALRSLYLATLVGLARRSLLRLSPERTNGQYLRELPRGPEQTWFAGLTRTFDAVQYGDHAPSQEDFERCLGLARQLVQQGPGA